MITFTQALISDAPLVQSLLATIWQQSYKDIYPEDFIAKVLQEWHNLEQLTAQISNPNYLFWIITNNEKPIGILSGEPSSIDFRLDRIYILPKEQQLGIGTVALNVLKTNYKGKITLEVEAENYKSVNFYFKQGFKIKKSFKDDAFNLECHLFLMEYIT